MDREVSDADLVVCRAGASTLAEITAAGRAAVLVPLPTATDDHQRKNAAVLAARGAAEVIDQSTLTGDRLAEVVLAMAANAERRQRMAEAARTLARPGAAKAIVDRGLALHPGRRAVRRRWCSDVRARFIVSVLAAAA